MAIEIEWQVKPPHQDKNETRRTLFPRIVCDEVIDDRKLAERMAARGMISKGNALAALDELADTIAELLRDGKSIKVSALGSFRLSIGTDATIHDNTRGSMQHIDVRGVRFCPSGELMRAVGKPTFRQAEGLTTVAAKSSAEIIPALESYFQSHDSITSAEFAHLFRLRRSTSFVRISELVKMGVLQRVGCTRKSRYIRGDHWQDAASGTATPQAGESIPGKGEEPALP